ncbi:peroxide stress protein YaaA [Roseburia hominis]
MKIIISPAKKMKVESDFLGSAGIPCMMNDTRQICEVMKSFSPGELQKIFKANDKITEENYRRYQEMDLDKAITPAVLAYSGLAFNNMAPQVFTDGQWEYVKKNLKILSGFYGILGALDGVVPYRLEMQAKVKVAGKKDLYTFWQNRIYQVLAKELREEEEGPLILNLASKEYSQVIEPFVEEDIRFVTCVFAEYVDGKLITKGTKAKMARGQMVAFLAKENAETLEKVKEFRELGFVWHEELSSEKELVFIEQKSNTPQQATEH